MFAGVNGRMPVHLQRQDWKQLQIRQDTIATTNTMWYKALLLPLILENFQALLCVSLPPFLSLHFLQNDITLFRNVLCYRLLSPRMKSF